MNYIRTEYMTNNEKTCRVTAICCNVPKQTNSDGIATDKMTANVFEVLRTNTVGNATWGQPNVANVKIASISEMESEDENNNATHFDAVLTFRYFINGYAPKTLTCTLKNVSAVENINDTPSAIPNAIWSEWNRFTGSVFSNDYVYLASAVLTFHG